MTKFAFEEDGLSEQQVRDALTEVFGEHDGKVIAEAAVPVALGVNRRAAGLEPRDGSAGGWLIALDWYCASGLFRLRVPAHSVALVQGGEHQ
jgi:hypothetical protein